MTETTTTPTADRPQPARAAWSAPGVTRIAAAEAENGLNPIREDGVFSRGS